MGRRGSDAAGADEPEPPESGRDQSPRPLGGDPTRAAAIKATPDRAARVGADGSGLLQRPADDLQAEALQRVESLRRDDVIVGDNDLALACAKGVADVLLTDDAHQRPSRPSSVEHAVCTARRTSASEPDTNRRPKRPTVRTSTILIEASSSA